MTANPVLSRSDVVVIETVASKVKQKANVTEMSAGNAEPAARSGVAAVRAVAKEGEASAAAVRETAVRYSGCSTRTGTDNSRRRKSTTRSPY